MRRKISVCMIAMLAILSCVSQSVSAQEAPGKEFDEYVHKALKQWEVPGVAIAIVKNDQIVFAKGYGVRKLGEQTPVDEKTLFAIGSSSKAFTAAAIAMLIDEGKLKWDDPAAKYLPGLQLFDPYASRELSVRDLLCHRSGLERGDLLWYGSDLSRDEILRRVRYLKPTWSFRGTFGYQNLMYLAAGQVIPSITGKSWDDFLNERIFTALAMTSSNTSIRELAKSNNVATPHAKIEEKVELIPWRNIDNIAPAGSINSNVVDLAQWVRLQLGEGKYQGKQLISSGAVKEMHTPQTIIRTEGVWEKLFPEAHFLTYGLGWFLQDYHGRKVVQHGGNIDGMSALVAMMPEEKLGIAILTNLNGTTLPTALANMIFDWYTKSPQKDWSAELYKSINGLLEAQKAAEKKKEEARVSGTGPSLALDKYAGTYKDDMYGEAKVAVKDGKLVTSYGSAFTGDLEHWHYNTFRVRWRDRTLGKGFINFTLGDDGKVDALKIENLTTFKRGPDPADTSAGIKMSEDALGKFAGKYAMAAPPIEVSLEMIGGQLKAMVPGQPVYTLVPVSPTRFRIDGAPAGYFLQFEVANDKPKTMTVEQGPNMRLTFLPKQ
jgi:CubicO group peptidase (beta-lactamase class C family)